MDTESLTRECSRQRDLWLLAIGAAMARDELRPRLVGYVGHGLADLVSAIRDGNRALGWKELGRFGLSQENGELAVDRLFRELERVEKRRVARHALTDLSRAFEDGADAAACESARKIVEALNG